MLPLLVRHSSIVRPPSRDSTRLEQPPKIEMAFFGRFDSFINSFEDDDDDDDSVSLPPTFFSSLGGQILSDGGSFWSERY